MPAASTATTAIGDTGPTAVSGPGPGTRRLRGRALWTITVLAGIAALTVLTASPDNGRMLDPAGTGAQGAHALVEVLRDHGVTVDVVGSQEDLRTAVGDGSGVSVVLGNSDYLGSHGAEQLLGTTAVADRLVALDPTQALVAGLDAGVSLLPAPNTTEPLPAHCTAPLVHPGDTVARLDVRLSTDDAAVGTSCFPLPGADQQGAGGAEDTADHGVGLLIVPAGSRHTEVALVGFPSALTNREITSQAHAGLALRLLGSSPRLIWYQPTVSDLAASGDTGRGEPVWPAWTGAVIAVLTLAWLLYAVARGRRLGRLVPEPLPVVVRAIETTRSRGELYRRARDRERAAAVLRRGTLSRLRRRLAAGNDTPALIQATAEASHTPVAEVAALLTGPPPPDDAGLVALARALTTLEEKVGR